MGDLHYDVLTPGSEEYVFTLNQQHENEYRMRWCAAVLASRLQPTACRA